MKRSLASSRTALLIREKYKNNKENEENHIILWEIKNGDKTLTIREIDNWCRRSK
jgi:hypothetical protein